MTDLNSFIKLERVLFSERGGGFVGELCVVQLPETSAQDLPREFGGGWLTVGQLGWAGVVDDVD